MSRTTAWMLLTAVVVAGGWGGCRKPIGEPVAAAPSSRPATSAPVAPVLEATPARTQPAETTPAPPVDTGVQRGRAVPAPRRTPQPKENYAAAPRRSHRIYVVRKGDTLQKISRKFYGTTRKWRRLYEANRDVLTQGPDKLQVGMRLVIP